VTSNEDKLQGINVDLEIWKLFKVVEAGLGSGCAPMCRAAGRLISIPSSMDVFIAIGIVRQLLTKLEIIASWGVICTYALYPSGL
jgi:hypothetical protein